MPFPGYAQVGGETEELAFLCQSTSIPAMAIGTTTVNFRGRPIYLAGDRTFEPWTIKVLNDTNFKLRDAFERWQNGINNMSDNEGLVNPADYQVDAFIDHLDRNGGTTIKSYTLRGCFPTSISPIDLDMEPTDAVEDFDVSFRYLFLKQEQLLNSRLNI